MDSTYHLKFKWRCQCQRGTEAMNQVNLQSNLLIKSIQRRYGDLKNEKNDHE